MTEKLLTTREVADRFQSTPKKVSSLARSLGVGMNLGGSAGFRFTEADVESIREALTLRAAS